MCLVTEQLKPKIAEEDIKVFKFLTQDMRSPFYDFRWNPGQLYKESIKKAKGHYSFFGNGDCEFFSDKYNISWSSSREAYDLPEGVVVFNEGFHSIKKSSSNDAGMGEYDVWECTIPAGSEYYEGPTGLVVSNQLIINTLKEKSSYV